MKHRFIMALIVAAAVAAAPGLPAVLSAQSAAARDMYNRALAQERIVRDDANKPTLVQMRHVVAAYEALVRRHPSSGYCDNALWQAGNLAALAYQHFGDDADRQAATRLFTQLSREYPASKLVPQAREALETIASPTHVSSTPLPASEPDAPPAPAANATQAGKSRADSGGGLATSGKQVALLKEIHREVLPDGVRITVDLDSEIAYHQEEIENPRRVFFDLKNVKAAPGLQDASLKYDSDLIREVRLGRHPQNTTRLVMDLAGVSSYTVYPVYGPYRLVIDFRRTSAAAIPTTDMGTTAPAVAAPSPTPPPPPVIAASRAVAPVAPIPQVKQTTIESKTAAAKEPLPSTPAPKVLPPAVPAANSNGKFSLSRQLGLGVSRVVIDAGHGGHDPGAHGSGVDESELTLDVALRVQKLLEKQDGIEVVMTRDTDVFIPLEERTAIANRADADLFLSIHANASRNVQARGIETYFLNFAMNPEAEAVAARENASSGITMHNLPDIVKTIALNNKLNESRDFAETVQKSMVKRLGPRNRTLRDLGVKQAPFVVLIGAGMPSVLAEISFVTNKQEGALLKTNAYRQQIAQALFDAIVDYQKSLKRMNSLAGKKATFE